MNKTPACRGQSQTQTFLTYPGAARTPARAQVLESGRPGFKWQLHSFLRDCGEATGLLKKMETVIISTSQGTYEDQMS